VNNAVVQQPVAWHLSVAREDPGRTARPNQTIISDSGEEREATVRVVVSTPLRVARSGRLADEIAPPGQKAATFAH